MLRQPANFSSIVTKLGALWVVAMLSACTPGTDGADDAGMAGDAGLTADAGTGDAADGGSGRADAGHSATDAGMTTFDPAWAALEDEILVLVNEMRTQGGDCPSGAYPPVGALAMQPNLREAARLHSADMAANGYFDHNSQDGRTPFDRINEAGYSGWTAAGENIAAGNASAQATFQQWVNSDGHCVNMMNANFNEIGVGYAADPNSEYRHYWTQNFGRR